METINARIRMKDKRYQIFVGSSILDSIRDFVKKNHNSKRVTVIVGENTIGLHKRKIIDAIGTLNPVYITVPSGESSKSRKMKEKIEDTLLNNKFGRDSLIIAIGGGVVGDLSGFIASTFNRGIPIIHIPTTLLAMADSSIGGKTAINTKHGKNLIGTVYQPAAVFADIDFLETLSDEEFRNGLAEIIKMSIIKDKNLFSLLEKNHKSIMARDKKLLQQIIKRSIELKKEVVEKDAEESNLRQILNFGHTFGHALEAYYKYKIRHGYAVAQGILVESKISELTENLNPQDRKKIDELLKSFGFELNIKNLNINKIIKFMISDKKSRNQKPRFVLLEKIGKIKSKGNNFSFKVDNKTIEKAIELCKND